MLAFGDSITNGGGELQWGVALQSWALWVARALGLPFTSYAFDGAGAADVVRRQIPAFERLETAANKGARYDVGCLYIGVNDVRAVDWDPRSYETDFRTALRFLTARCTRTLALTGPLDLGRPRAGAKVQDMNEIIRSAAADQQALTVELADFGARNQVMVDHVHPTAFGQIAIAERALNTLERDGLPAAVRPSSLISYDRTHFGRLRGDVTYAYRHAKVTARSFWIQARP